jgi:hypothetical protein
VAALRLETAESPYQRGTSAIVVDAPSRRS